MIQTIIFRFGRRTVPAPSLLLHWMLRLLKKHQKSGDRVRLPNLKIHWVPNYRTMSTHTEFQ